MPKRNLHITDQASVMLDQYKAKHPDKTLGEIASEAIIQYVLMEQRDYAEKMVQDAIELRFRSMEMGLRTLLASIAIDVDMILHDVLEQRLEERAGSDPKEIYAELRREGVNLFNKKRAFQE